jgi:radical SAM superfamily enzyme YgiQ (UPF0313 family)
MILVAHGYHQALDPHALAEGKPVPPLGTAVVAARLRRAGHGVAFWDSTFVRDASEFGRALAGHRPDRVLLAADHHAVPAKMCLEAQRRATFEMIGLARASGAEVLVSGPDVSDQPALYLQAGASAAVRGEIDHPAERWAGGAPLSSVPGAMLASGAEIPDPAPATELTDVPPPAWDLIDLREYARRWRSRHGYWEAPVSAARGCPYRCNWCAKPIWGRTLKLRDPGAVVADARDLAARGADRIWFTDDIFALKPSWLKKFRAEVERAGGILPYRCLSRADLLRDPSYADDLAATGCREVWMGAESGSDAVLEKMDKDGTVDDIARATVNARDRLIRVGFFLQLGYPGETLNDVQATVRMVRTLRPDDLGISVSYPLPGTPFYENVKDRLLATNWQTAMDCTLLFESDYPQEFYTAAREVIRREHAVSEGIKAARALLLGRGGRRELRRVAATAGHLPRIGWYHLEMQLRGRLADYQARG